MSRLTKPAPMHNGRLAPAMCGCWSCSKVILSLRCPFEWPAQTVRGQFFDAGRCGDYRGHSKHLGHTLWVATAFETAEERVRLDAPPETLVAP